MIGTKLEAKKTGEYYEVVDAYNTSFTRYYVLCDKNGEIKTITHETLHFYKVVV